VIPKRCGVVTWGKEEEGNMKKSLGLVIVFALAGAVGHAEDAYIKLLRSDVKARKLAIIANVMQFTSEESKAFWPVYREYDAELSNIGDSRIQLIKDYVQTYKTMADGKAKELI
jgi:hypothetical protein